MKANSFNQDTINQETLNNGGATVRYSMTTQLNGETHCVGHHSGTDTYSVNREAGRIMLIMPALTCLSLHLRLWDPDTPLPPSFHLNHHTKMDR